MRSENKSGPFWSGDHRSLGGSLGMHQMWWPGGRNKTMIGSEEKNILSMGKSMN